MSLQSAPPSSLQTGDRGRERCETLWRSSPPDRRCRGGRWTAPLRPGRPSSGTCPPSSARTPPQTQRGPHPHFTIRVIEAGEGGNLVVHELERESGLADAAGADHDDLVDGVLLGGTRGPRHRSLAPPRLDSALALALATGRPHCRLAATEVRQRPVPSAAEQPQQRRPQCPQPPSLLALHS